MKDIFNEIHEINQIDKCSIEKAVCKMAEEFGELAQAVNMTIGKKRHNLAIEQIDDNIAEETADLIQNAICVADKRGIHYEVIHKKLVTKTAEWKQAVLEKRDKPYEPSLLADALKNLMTSMSGGSQKCGHIYDCMCAWNEAKKALDNFQKKQ